MVCAACSAEVPDDDQFCENCGAKLPVEAAPSPGCTCGAAADEVDEEGFCLCCGRRVRRPASDHMEASYGPGFAAVSDRGLRHERNEDRFALVQGAQGYGLVVCDGVSATTHAEVASALAAERVAARLQVALEATEPQQARQVLEEAVRAAAEALCAQTGADQGGTAPSTTLAAALVSGPEITVGWVGDSRAYWIDAEGAHLLTHDHSWMRAVVEDGTMSMEEAEASPQAHAITRWLGADAEDAGTPEYTSLRVAGAGTLLLCSDGLWNYVPAAESLSALVQSGQGEDALELARRLVQFANDQGGRDNITVAVLQMPESRDGTAKLNQ